MLKNLNKIFLISLMLLLLIIFSGIVFAVHCYYPPWYPGMNENVINPEVDFGREGLHIPVNFEYGGNEIDFVLFPGSISEIGGIRQYNFTCNDGVQRAARPLMVVNIVKMDEDPVIEYCGIDDLGADCSSTKNPVLGENGKLYTNPCLACASNEINYYFVNNLGDGMFVKTLTNNSSREDGCASRFQTLSWCTSTTRKINPDHCRLTPDCSFDYYKCMKGEITSKIAEIYSSEIGSCGGSQISSDLLNRPLVRVDWLRNFSPTKRANFCRCLFVDRLRNSSWYPGRSGEDTISFSTFDLDFGVYQFNALIDNQTIFIDGEVSDPNECLFMPENVVSKNFIYSPFPSLFVFEPAPSTISIEKNKGITEKNVQFTLVRNGFLDTRIDGLKIFCGDSELQSVPGVSCKIEDDYTGFKITNDNQELILNVKIEIDNSVYNFKDFLVQLRVDYSFPQIVSDSIFEREQSTVSNLIPYQASLIDKQDFQIKIVSQEDYSLAECVSHQGFIGVTGEDYYPRINIEFGRGSALDIDACDVENENWVYCSQNEFLFSLVGKIAKMIRDNSQEEKFTINIRDIKLSNESIRESLNNFDQAVFKQTGLEGYHQGNVGQQIESLKQLFVNNVVFTGDGGYLIQGYEDFSVGEYEITISIGDIQANELFSNQSPYNVLIDRIEIDLTSTGERPSIDWFFYRKDFEKITGDNVINRNVNPSNLDLVVTNNLERGLIMVYNSHINSAELLKSFAIPLFIKVERVDGVGISNKFTLKKEPSTYQNLDYFTYWTSIGSSEGDGCVGVSPEASSGKRFFKIKDSRVRTISNNLEHEFKLREFDYIQENAAEYLQTVVYVPYEGHSGEKFSIGGNISVYSEEYVQLFNSADDPITNIEFDSSSTSHVVSDLMDVFDGIKEGEICIAREQIGASEEWILFWNEKRIVDSLIDRKRQIHNENNNHFICELS